MKSPIANPASYKQKYLSILFFTFLLTAAITATIYISSSLWEPGHPKHLPITRKDDTYQDIPSNYLLINEQIPKWKIFGNYDPSTSQLFAFSKAKPNVKLVGTGYSTNLDSWAILSVGDNEEKALKVGDEVFEGAYVEKILPKLLLVRNGNNMKTIVLSDSGNPKDNIITPNSIGILDTHNKPKNIDIRKKILHFLHLSPVNIDLPLGYMVIGKPRAPLVKYGIEKGDIILSVNGYFLGSENNDILAIKSYQDTKHATIIVKRDNREIMISYPN